MQTGVESDDETWAGLKDEEGFTAGLRATAALAGPSAKLPFKIVSAGR